MMKPTEHRDQYTAGDGTVAGQGRCAKAVDGRQDGMAEWESGELRGRLDYICWGHGELGEKKELESVVLPLADVKATVKSF